MVKRQPLLVAAGYVGTVVAANWAVANLAPLPVGFGQQASAGVLFAGLAFTFRDALQELAGKAWTFAAILAGTTVSLAISGWLTPPGGLVPLALAAAAAFLVSELADMGVYTPLRDRGQPAWALLASNTVGAAVDSAVFLWLASGSLDFFAGQMLGKTYVTLPFVAAVLVWQTARRRAAA